ncbi:uncharacterized protein ARMOST_04316 [Armillaria ostoyae]|uniref:Peptidase C14 caspase domain-containing protein n=1 Tax=Armillaria ostoyae TaxID=47428 RepID=A0A284QX62_ARMOS|nr:uncharacterized protein ARMOST_04316 [Armillaria ostoyae]
MVPDEDARAQRKKEVKKEPAQHYTIVPGERTSSTVDLQEAEGHARSPKDRRIGRHVFGIPFFRAEAPSVFRRHCAEDCRVGALFTRHSVLRISPSSTRSARYSVDGSRFWAILIGIDVYKHSRLRGCVSDTLLIKRFFTDDLGMPEGRIQCLLGPNNPTPGDPKLTPTPSHANIVDMLYSLVHSPEIDQNDNIIIYYAGHGSIYRCPEHPHAVRCHSGLCPTEALCPLDRDTQDADGKWIPDISDREINTLFKHISLAKGNKITFIADCCYARSFSRQDQDSVRSTHPTSHASLDDMLRAADERWKQSGDPNYRSVLSKDWQPDMSSRVVLAACKDNQSAKEEQGHNGFHGVFTRTLVRVLRSIDYKKGTTYIDLVHLVNQSISQTPVVAGVHKSERLWYTKPR